MKRTFTTSMPDRAGAFLLASRCIARAGANITRVSYNKAVDTHTLFVEADGSAQQLEAVSEELAALGYLSSDRAPGKVILMEFRLPDVPGALVPVLELISRYDFNISYMSSQENGTAYQYYKMGLFIEDPDSVTRFLEQVSQLCEVKIINYDGSEKSLDNTVFYLSFANDIAGKLGLDPEEAMALTVNANRIMQMLDEKNQPPYKTFSYIGRFAAFLADSRGAGFRPRITKLEPGAGVTLHVIEPPCGSNTYILERNGRLLFVDCGFARFRGEMLRIFHHLYPDFDTRVKKIVVTHADGDHCGLLDLFDEVLLSRESYADFAMENRGEGSLREQNPLHAPYSKISKILSQYRPPRMDSLQIVGGGTEQDGLLPQIGQIVFEDLVFDVYAGNGGHLPGEIVLLCRAPRLAFTGDIYVNIKGFTPEQAQFNRLAPYLMTSVDTNPKKASFERDELLRRLDGGGWLLCGGHGAPRQM